MNTLYLIRLAVLIPAAAVLLSCAAPGRPRIPEARVPGVQGSFRAGDIVDLHRGEAISFPTLLERLAPHDLVFVGEVHDQAEHHLIQVQLLQGLMEQGRPVVVAMECFRSHQQNAVDRHLSGALPEEAFLEQVDWDSGWGFPYRFYRPLVSLARENRARVLAMNVPRELVSKVARAGLKGLTDRERARLPRDIDLTDREHRRYVREAYLMHDRAGIPDFDFFYEAQCVYDEAMAERLARYFEEEGRHRAKVAAFAGNGHLIRRGIPDRVTRRTPVSAVIVLPYPLGEDIAVDSGAAHFLWLTPPCNRGRPEGKESAKDTLAPSSGSDHERK